MVIKNKTNKETKKGNHKQNKSKTKKQQHNESKQTTPHPIHLGMSSNECRIPNVSICTTMSLKLALLIFSNMSSEVIHVLSNTFNFFFLSQNCWLYNYILLSIKSHICRFLKAIFSHVMYIELYFVSFVSF